MRTVETSIFYINGKKLELPLFEKGDRVYIPDHDSLAIERVEGTVTKTSEGGLFVNVEWDKPRYDAKGGGAVEVGSGRMVNSILFIED